MSDEDTLDGLRMKLRVAERIKNAAIDCNLRWEDITEELIWERDDAERDLPISEARLTSFIARFPHFDGELREYVKHWNSEPKLTDEELAEIELTPEDYKAAERSRVMMTTLLKCHGAVRKVEAEAEKYRVLRTTGICDGRIHFRITDEMDAAIAAALATQKDKG